MDGDAAERIPIGAVGLSANEQRVLELIRRQEAAAKADLARSTGLSPAAIGGLVRQLEARGLVTPGAPVKGKVGQPSVPYALSGSGAYALGFKIGRRSSEAALLDAGMRIVELSKARYEYPDVASVLDFVEASAAALLRPGDRAARLCGCAVAAPSEIWTWRDAVSAPPGALEAWRDVDVARDVSRRVGAPARLMNDATAACAGHVAHAPQPGGSLIYVYVGWLLGGGVALDGRVVEGTRGGAGALGSFSVAETGGGRRQLLEIASIATLERSVLAAGGNPSALAGDGADWSSLEPALGAWIAAAADGVAQALAAASAVLDFERAVIDGVFPPAVRARFVNAVQASHARLDLRGLAPIAIEAGALGSTARVFGAGCAPLLAAFGRADAVFASKSR